MAPFLIRPATQADALGAAAVVKDVFDEYDFTWEPEGYHRDLYELESYYTARGHRFWVAEQAGKIVGTVALERFDRIEGPMGTLVEQVDPRFGLSSPRIAGCDCALDRLYVHPSARRQGLGLALFRTAVVAAKDLEHIALEIWSDKRFGEAHRLYQKEGAEIIGDRICHDPDQSPEWGLMLRI